MPTTHAPDSRADFIVLHGSHSSVVLEARATEAPLWRYWGPRLPDGCLPLAPLRDGRPIPPSSMELDQPLTIAPTFGVGWYGQSALLAHRSGQQFAQAFTACRVETLEADQRIAIHLTDSVAQLRLVLHMALDAHDVLQLSSQLINDGTSVLDVQWLAAGTVPLPGDAQAVRNYAGQWANEFQLQVDPLSRSLWQRENRRGRTSHDSFPGAVVTMPGATEHIGTVYGAQLAWSGNHRQVIEWLHDGQYQWQMGEWLAPGEVLLQPGETLDAPTLFASCSTAGLNGLAANFYATVRSRLPWPGGRMRPRPVHLNTWEAVYFDHRTDDIRALAKAAASVGVERFVLDDGWFQGRHHDRAALGDWWPDAGKYPHGLQPLASHVNELGMEFGLWVEPEMVNPDSQLFRAHPDWALQLEGRPLLTMRNQLVLDVARPEVADYLFGKLDFLLRSVPIAYLKWDMNRDLTTAGNALGRPAYRSVVRALHALLDRVRAAHPALEIESCASGGARLDLGVLAHTHRVWTSDCNDALSRVAIQRGALQFLPPEILGAHIGPAPAHTTGRSQSLNFRAGVALCGHLGIEADVRHMTDAERSALGQWVSLYKQLRNRLHTGQVWLGGDEKAGDGVLWQAHGDANASEVLLLVYRTTPTSHRNTPPLRLPMLRPAAHYTIERLDPTPPDWTSSPLNDAALAAGDHQGHPPVAHGAWLAAVGLPLPRMNAESALIYRLRFIPQ
jgi:alpha-galactosidase